MDPEKGEDPRRGKIVCTITNHVGVIYSTWNGSSLPPLEKKIQVKKNKAKSKRQHFIMGAKKGRRTITQFMRAKGRPEDTIPPLSDGGAEA